MRAVLDSNICVSALMLPGGTADRAIRAATRAAVAIFISRAILDEVLGVMSRKFARSPEELARTALYLASVAHLIVPERRIGVLADTPDNRVLECASMAGADTIVTGDREMLLLGAWESIEILSLRQFVERLDGAREVHQARAPYRNADQLLLQEALRGVADIRHGRVKAVAPEKTRGLPARYDIRPFPKRGRATVTSELVNGLREGDAY